MRSCRRARVAPRRWWAPKPNEIGRGSGRSRRSSSASVQRRGEVRGADHEPDVVRRAGSCTPATSKSAVACRPVTCAGGSKRNSSSTAFSIRSGSSRRSVRWSGCRAERDEGVAERPGHRLVSSEEQNHDHGDDLFVVEVVLSSVAARAEIRSCPGWSAALSDDGCGSGKSSAKRSLIESRSTGVSGSSIPPISRDASSSGGNGVVVRGSPRSPGSAAWS